MDEEFAAMREENLKWETNYNMALKDKNDIQDDLLDVTEKLQKQMAAYERLKKELESQKKTSQLRSAKYDAQVRI